MRTSTNEKISGTFVGVIHNAVARMTETDRRLAWSRSGRGVKIYTKESQLDDYLFLYGEMHVAKMMRFLPSVPFDEMGRQIAVVDWGCGQGLAAACAFDALRQLQNAPNVVSVRLIEISDVARKMAQSVLSKYEEVRDVRAYTWNLAELAKTGIDLPVGVPVLHLFSNILDVEAIDLHSLADVFRKITAGHISYVLSVSPKSPLERAIRLKSFFSLVSGLKPIAFDMQSISVPNRRYYPFSTCSCYGMVYRISESVAECATPFIPDPAYTEDELLAFAAANMVVELEDAIDSCICVNCRDVTGHTPLVLAAKYGGFESINLLLRQGADKNARNDKGATALYFAAKYGFENCTKALLEAGADVELAPSVSRVTPYLVAVRHGHESLARMLAAAGARTDVYDARGRNADDYRRLGLVKEEVDA